MAEELVSAQGEAQSAIDTYNDALEAQLPPIERARIASQELSQG